MKKIRINPRKQAKQRRAQDTIEYLVQATARILIKEGYGSASTNRIAKEAGLSVGSLYQYFPSKEALVAALIDRHFKRIMSVLQESLLKAANASLEVATRELVRAMIMTHAIEPRLHRAIDEQVPRVGKLKSLRDIQTQAALMIRVFLENRRDQLRIKDTELAAFVVVQATQALIHAGVNERPDFLTNDRLLDETVALLLGYLRGAGT